MKKILFSTLILSQLFVSCTRDLEDTVTTLEQEQQDLLVLLDELRTEAEQNEADLTAMVDDVNANLTDFNDKFNDVTFDKVSFTHSYAYDSETPLSDSYDLYFSSPDYQYIRDNGDGTYYVYIYNWEGTEEATTATFRFTYDTSTETSTLDYYHINYYNQYYDNINIRNSRANTEYDSVNLVVNHIDVETGTVSASLNVSYISGSQFSEYGQAGELVVHFDGTLKQVYPYPDAGQTDMEEVVEPVIILAKE